MKLLPAPAVATESGLFGVEPGSAITPIAAELRAHFERGGSVADGVQLVAALERAVTRKLAGEPRSKQSAVRGSRLSAGWEPSIVDAQFALDRGLPHARLSIETEKFRNYWTAKSGVSAIKRDWSATWRNWIINTAERFENGKERQRATTRSHAILAGVAAAADRRARERNAAGQQRHATHNGGPTPSMILNSSEREFVEQRVADRASWLDVGQPITIDGRTLTNYQAVNVIIAKLLVKSRGSKLDETSSDALAEDYLDAIEDLPAWSVRNALRKWNRAESAKFDGNPHNFDWRPTPATLRRLAEIELGPIRAEMVQLKKLLIAVPRFEYSEEHRAKMLALLTELGKSLRAL
jgi:hypothetical protein